ncbi:disease resistance protein RGA5-like [Triticum dicoccoides]|uniref:disease resistance protein RGA5-like n=1 Tax=Triticum dicoccoides TaxID=85692 RepID=UPI00188FF872|nr:disease resistance protein RGA5-like [Triticum dicoccoides]
MEIAMGAIGPLLPKLTSLLVGEFTLEKRVKKGIESLVTELTLMHAALRTVAKVPPEELGEGVKIWAGKVKELSYQMEDIIDTFMVHVEGGGEAANPKNRVKNLLKKTIKLFKKGKSLHGISDALEEAVGQAKQLAELRQRYELVHQTPVSASIDPRVMALYKDVTELIGIEDTRDELINMLIGGDDWLNHPLKVISIVGFGGLGKTTLAKAAYDKIKVQFDCSAFVSVSQNPDMRKILKDILFELDKNKYANIYNAVREEKHLIDELIEFLNNKRYLIVIDDIWDKKVWEVIKCAFSKKSFGSRLITTSRIVSVSEACCSSGDDIYRMRALSNDVSRRLFYKRVFSHEQGCPQEFLQVSEDILKKCGGVPLAIITIASLLASNCQIKTKDQWHGLLNSIGHGLTEDRSLEEMKKILLFSYYDLPFHLKPCLLYLSIFPEDHKIMRDELIWRWIAEGFVYSEKQEASLYELGDSYFNELINRNMIQPIDINEDGRVEACRVHDMVLDTICSLSSEENFVTILDGTRRNVPISQSRVHILSIQKGNVDVATTNMAQVRSVTVFENDNVHHMPLVSSSRVLRVLALEDCTVSDIGYVGSLVHLRYLRVGSKNIKKLPVDIGKLYFLQTLDLRGTCNLENLPSSIVSLRNLKCLYINGRTELPSGMDNLTTLEVIHGLQVGHAWNENHNLDIVKELCHLTKLRVLMFIWSCMHESTKKALMESLSNLHNLESLHIKPYNESFDPVDEGWVPPPQLRRLSFAGLGSFQTLPAWINLSSLHLLSCLSCLVIEVFEVRPEDIRLLGMLPTLRYLNFEINAIESLSQQGAVEMLVVTADAFPHATKLSFRNIPVLPSTFPRGAAPRLKHLESGFPARWISRDDLDLGMGHLPSLENVEFELWYEESSDSEVNEAEESTNSEVNKAEVALKAAASDHPNRPDLHIDRSTFW